LRIKQFILLFLTLFIFAIAGDSFFHLDFLKKKGYLQL